MKRLWIAALLAALRPGAALAQATGGAFLEIPASPRAYALGQSNGVAALGAQAVDGANPANLGLMTRRFEAFSSYASLMDGAQYMRLAAAFAPSGGSFGLDAFGVSLTRLGVGGFQVTDDQGNRTGGTFSNEDVSAAFSAAGKATSRLRLGGTVKVLQSSIAGYKSNAALAGDLGLTYTAPTERPFSVGLSLTNLGQGLRFLDQSDPLPSAVNIGTALGVGPALAVLEVNRRWREQKTEVGVGLEYGLGPVAFRAGYLAQSQAGNLALQDQTGASRTLGALQGGLGLQFGSLRLDYAISQQAVELGASQRLALTVQWGGPSAKAATAREWRSSPDASDWLIRPLGGY